MRNVRKHFIALLKMVMGCACFALGFDLFLEPNAINTGGLTGLSMIVVKLSGKGSIGLLTALLNVPLFVFAGAKIGKRFFFGSLVGMILSSVFIDLFSMIPSPVTEPLVGALYGGVLCGLGLGLVFSIGGSTGGSDIIVRFLKLKNPNTPIGVIAICFDMVVAILTGIAFWDISRALYSGIVIFLAGQVMDAVVYRFDYSRVALIISKDYEKIASEIASRLERGATYLRGEGVYTHTDTKVILTAVKRQQLAELKQLVVEIDPNAFIIVQEAHQVLGDGFLRYSKDAL